MWSQIVLSIHSKISQILMYIEFSQFKFMSNWDIFIQSVHFSFWLLNKKIIGEVMHFSRSPQFYIMTKLDQGINSCKFWNSTSKGYENIPSYCVSYLIDQNTTWSKIIKSLTKFWINVAYLWTIVYCHLVLNPEISC